MSAAVFRIAGHPHMKALFKNENIISCELNEFLELRFSISWTQESSAEVPG